MTRATNALSVIHVAGTKGKGSTCAFVEHSARECGVRTGLYTSPHLVDVRERFRIDGVPVSKTVFVKNFWWLKRNIDAKCRDLGGVPAYFRFLTLLGFRIFAEEKVECCILEVGLGGRLDATNLVRAPVVCGITSLGMDHVEVLGDTLAKIAREKAGIFKPRVPAITSPQPEEAMAALKARAAEIEASALTIAPPLRAYEGDAPPDGGGGGGGETSERVAPLLLRLRLPLQLWLPLFDGVERARADYRRMRADASALALRITDAAATDAGGAVAAVSSEGEGGGRKLHWLAHWAFGLVATRALLSDGTMLLLAAQAACALLAMTALPPLAAATGRR